MEIGQTRPAPVQEGCDPPTQKTNRDLLLAQVRKFPKVDANGWPIKGKDPSVTNFVEPPSTPPVAPPR
jgi:hypothetical protein